MMPSGGPGYNFPDEILTRQGGRPRHEFIFPAAPDGSALVKLPCEVTDAPAAHLEGRAEHANWPAGHSDARARREFRRVRVPTTDRCRKVQVAYTAAHAVSGLKEIVDGCKAAVATNDRDGCIIGADGEFAAALRGNPEQFVVWFQVASRCMVLMLFLPVLFRNPQDPDCREALELLRVLLEMLDIVKCGVQIERDIDAVKLQYAFLGEPLEPQGIVDLADHVKRHTDPTGPKLSLQAMGFFSSGRTISKLNPRESWLTVPLKPSKVRYGANDAAQGLMLGQDLQDIIWTDFASLCPCSFLPVRQVTIPLRFKAEPSFSSGVVTIKQLVSMAHLAPGAQAGPGEHQMGMSQWVTINTQQTAPMQLPPPPPPAVLPPPPPAVLPPPPPAILPAPPAPVPAAVSPPPPSMHRTSQSGHRHTCGVAPGALTSITSALGALSIGSGMAHPHPETSRDVSMAEGGGESIRSWPVPLAGHVELCTEQPRGHVAGSTSNGRCPRPARVPANSEFASRSFIDTGILATVDSKRRMSSRAARGDR